MSERHSTGWPDDDLYGAAPLYEDMVPVDERSPTDEEDVLVPAFTAVAEASGKSSTATPRSTHRSAQSTRRTGSGATIRPGTLRMSRTRPLRLPLANDSDGNGGADDERRRRASGALVMPLFSTEVERGNGSVVHETRFRRASVSCVSLSAADAATLAAAPERNPRSKALRDSDGAAANSPHSVPALMPPNLSSTATTAVFERTNFITKYSSPSDRNGLDTRSFPVHLHVYDLAGGLLHRHSKEVVGTYVAGMYHSAIACYGMEFYFEGGIGVAGAGRTRFGTKYKSVPLGSTTTLLSVFMEWIDNKEVTSHQVNDYDLTGHNCHHFCNEAAEFLLGHANLVPNYVFSTTDDLLRSTNGKAVYEVMDLVTKGTQSAVARLLHTRVLERQASLDMILHAVTACGVLTMPPTLAVLFRVEDSGLCLRFFTCVEPYIAALVDKGVLKASTLTVYRGFARQLVGGADTLYGHNVILLADIFTEVLLANPLPLWGPPLNALRIAVLHKSVATAVVFHPTLLRLLALASRDLPRLLPDGRLALLRLLCNFSSCSHGAVAHQDARFALFWVSAVGQGLLDDNGIVVYTAACLAANLASSIVITTTPSLRKFLAAAGDRHPLICLLTISLYNVNYRTAQELPEPAFNMLLLAILKIMSSSTTALDRVVQHSFPIRYAELLKRAETNESRALLCILKTLDDLYKW